MSIEIDLGNSTFTVEKLEEKINQDQNVIILRLHLNNNPTIIKQISPYYIKFKSLQVLNLGCNNIANIEVLQKMYLNNLQELHLFANKLTSLKTLRKCYFPELQYINLVDNRLYSLNGIQQWNFPKLEQFYAYDNRLNTKGLILRSSLNHLRSLQLGDSIEQYECMEWLLMVRFPKVAEAAISIDEQQF